MDASPSTVDVVVVYQRQEFYVATQASSSSRRSLPVDLLQCQLFSLLGVAPDDQVLLSSNGEVIYSPAKIEVETIAVSTDSRPRFFLFFSSEKTRIGPKLPELTSDWTQICTKSTFGELAVVQNAYRKTVVNGGDPFKTLICEPCARTCTTAFQPVTPKEWKASKILASRFISDVVVVAGEVDVAAPPGFTKLPVDLNFSASGDYVYLCVKRGGTRALTQLHILFQRLRESKADSSLNDEVISTPEKVIDVNCNSGGAFGDGTGVDVRVGFDSVQLMGDMEQHNTLAIADIAVVIGDQSPPSSAYMKIPRNLNEGAPAAKPIFLCYQLSPLGGFVCDSSREHSEFGECLFATRHLSSVVSLLDLDERRLVARSTIATDRNRKDAAFMDAEYRQHQPGMLKRLQGGLERAQSYESKQMQEEALKRIPVDKLHERARANPSPMPHYQDELVKQLLHWFKHEFFSWMNQPRCSACNHDKTRSVRTEGPKTAEEISGHASRVEVYQCPACGAFTRFPRYNDPVKLLDTRTGRCGEWANCFTLCCRAMGFEARYVLDVTDHVWTEVYSEHFKRWLHCDSCENQLDCPLTYEVGWGKKLSYIFSFAHDEVVDTARRYTQNWADMISRRQDVSEKWLAMTIDQMNLSLRGRQTPERVAIVLARAESEREELLRGRQAKSTEVKGRVSGSTEWKHHRKEDGKKTAATDSVPAAVTQAPHHRLLSTPTTQILQEVCRNMVIGCQPENSNCTNPFCLIGRTAAKSLNVSLDVNERAAQAIQVMTTLSANNFSPESLAMLGCPVKTTELRWFMWKNNPWVYLPLQDPPSAVQNVRLIDISGHGNHVDNLQSCSLRKPFRIPNSGRAVYVDEGEKQRDDEAYGMQLLAGQHMNIPVTQTSSSTGYTLSFLVRLDQGAACDVTRGVHTALSARLGTPGSKSPVFRVYWDYAKRHFTCELRAMDEAPQTSECAASVLAFGLYAHVAIMQTTSEVAAYINGTRMGQSVLKTGEVNVLEGEQVIVLEGPTGDTASTSAVISHVAVVPTQSSKEVEELCAVMKEIFVAAPPLKAFGPSGECTGEKCLEKAAEAQSGYRVSRVLLWGGEFFDGLQFVYDKSSATDGASADTVYGALVGNANAKRQASSPSATLELLPDEVITRVSGRKGAWTDCICLVTNFGRSVTCGGKGGGDFSVPTPVDSEIRFITCKAGDHLTDIRAFVLETSSAKAVADNVVSTLKEILSSSESAIRQNAISAALRYLGNIALQPKEPKFQRIRASNKFFASNVGALGADGAKAFMSWCGFDEVLDQGEQFFCFQTSAESQHPAMSPLRRISAEADKRIHFLKKM